MLDIEHNNIFVAGHANILDLEDPAGMFMNFAQNGGSDILLNCRLLALSQTPSQRLRKEVVRQD